jgi:hypothetical protein
VDKSKAFTFQTFLPTTVVLCLIGWGGLLLVTFLTLPTLGPRWLFFFLGVLAMTGAALPLVYFLNRRFPSTPPVEPDVILRQAIWFGIYGGLIAWLQLGRVLNPVAAVIIAAVLALIEGLLRMWERSRFKPGSE